MIKGIHSMLYSGEPDALRLFFRDKLGFQARDIGEGWLIFDVPGGELGVHPVEKENNNIVPNGTHEISFFCENIVDTVADLKNKGVEFRGEIEDHEYGLVTYFKVPGNFYLQLYQPKY